MARSEPLKSIARGFRDRTLKNAQLATRLGTGYVKRQLGVSRAWSDKEAIEFAETLVDEVGALKGLVMKFGQIASYMPGAFPPAAQRVLSQLQAKTVSMERGEVEAVLRAEFSQGSDELFEHFDDQPFAAASIGQVHRARFEGHDVAVKVQYPGIEDVLRDDLRHAGVMSRLASLGTGFDGQALAAELRERVLEECDYHLEAANQRSFAELLGAFEGAHVPEVFADRSSRRVLTSQLVDAQDLYSFAANADVEARNRAGATIFRACFGSIFEHCIYNADPHPGNYLMHDDGRVTFLDFGCVRRFDVDMIDTWKRTAIAVTENRRAEFERHFVDLGLVPNPRSFDWDHQWRVMQYVYRPFTQTEPFTYTKDYVEQSYDLLIYRNPNRTRSGMPPAWLFLNRLQWGLNAVLAELEATAPWGEYWNDAIRSPTRPWPRPTPA